MRPESVPQVNDALASRHSDGAPTEHRMTVTMAPGASSDCTKAYPIASDAPTTSPSHGNTSSVHGESPRPIPEKRYGLSHPRVHLPMRCTSSNCESVVMLFVHTMCAPAMKAVGSHEALLLEVFGLS